MTQIRMTVRSFTNRQGVRVRVVSGPHPDRGTPTHYIAINGEPMRRSQGGVSTFPSREAATFAAKMYRPRK